MRFGCACEQLKFGKMNLEKVLQSQILHYTCVRWLLCLSFKVKIAADQLQRIGRSAGCFVDLWRNNGVSCVDDVAVSGRLVRGMRLDQRDRRSMMADFKMSCWNCRGLSNSVPYIRKLMNGVSKILVNSEHWLWSYELQKLREIHEDFEVFGNAYSRLTEPCESRRCFGGVGVL